MSAVKPTIFTGITSISERSGIRAKNGDVGVGYVLTITQEAKGCIQPTAKN